jgi:putative ABC transport system ATP-binding protein
MKPMKPMKPVCELIGVSKVYQGHRVLDDMSLAISEGEMVAITGKSGSGKTTVLNILGLLETPDRGTVQLFGEKSPRTRSRKANQLLRFRLGYLFQNYALIENETVDYNLTVAQAYAKATSRDRQKLKAEALQRVGLSDASRKKIYELSGGEQQRVAIARLLLKPCDLVLADEPTGSLDPENRDEVLQMLHELNASGKTVVLVTHDEQVAESCHRVIELGKPLINHHERVAESGSRVIELEKPLVNHHARVTEPGNLVIGLREPQRR